ncbi:transketolase [Thermoanaerobacterium thermosaccharolyticum]|uniref:Transketolase n=1 Tax=Thermoanaerobacterium thermosaccharolyticum TaxID=1517 RepID=A0A223HXE0_THETR|nr:transketolase [Thermoanaerobacterium thermosaccharolyticum]AST57150.1 transketolase [Thermoanaerobacterium thermosaccharolyticum]PHO07245.1 transketolase [Thermoanaerobacterium thermosaccharolyticum]
MDKDKIDYLKKIAIEIRRDSIDVLKTAGSGHLGGSLSAVELMVYLYFHKMNVDPKEPYKSDRDIFILSKGHASIGYYCVLARRGFFSYDELKTYRKINSRLQGHPHIDDVPGIECSSGSLGQGLSFGIGIALGYKKKGLTSNVYVMVGDGELEEGQIWEALMLQSYLKLDNLIIIIDNNKLQLDDFTENITGINNLKKKFESFDFNVSEINGNDFESIDNAFSNLRNDKPNIIIANTVKGKGISFMENKIEWHSKKIDDEEYEKAIEELNSQEESLNE